ncbi:hypothetical protein JOM56_013317 [Amanita muscaria]
MQQQRRPPSRPPTKKNASASEEAREQEQEWLEREKWKTSNSRRSNVNERGDLLFFKSRVRSNALNTIVYQPIRHTLHTKPNNTIDAVVSNTTSTTSSTPSTASQYGSVGNDDDDDRTHQPSPVSGSGVAAGRTNTNGTAGAGSSTLNPPSSSTTPTRPGPLDPVKASVAHLLTRAYSLPCSTAAQAFAHLVQPVARFQLALDALLPLLDAGAVEDEKNGWECVVQLAELPQRILMAYRMHQSNVSSADDKLHEGVRTLD